MSKLPHIYFCFVFPLSLYIISMEICAHTRGFLFSLFVLSVGCGSHALVLSEGLHLNMGRCCEIFVENRIW